MSKSHRKRAIAAEAKSKADAAKKIKMDEEAAKEHVYEPKAYNDLEIHVDGHVFYCHQARLAEHSEYFEHYFELKREGQSVQNTKHEMLIWPPIDLDANGLNEITGSTANPVCPFHSIKTSRGV